MKLPPRFGFHDESYISQEVVDFTGSCVPSRSLATALRMCRGYDRERGPYSNVLTNGGIGDQWMQQTANEEIHNSCS